MNNIRIAVIGVGHLGKNHAKHLSKIPGCTLVGVADTNQPAAEEIAQLYQAKAYTDYKKVLRHVDAVSIATPTVAHYAIARKTLAKGIHTFIEKPITTTVAEANKLISLAEKHKAVLQVGHIERFNPAFVAAKEYLQNPKFIECHRLSSFSFRSIDIDIVLDLMIHDIDLILSIVKSPVKKVDAVGVKIISEKNDLANARLVFANGCVANLTASRASDKAMRKMRIFTQPFPISASYPKSPTTDKSSEVSIQNDAERAGFTGQAYTSIDFAERTASVYESKGDLSTLAANPPPGFNPKEFMLDKFINVRNLAITPYDQLEQELTSFVETISGNKTPQVSGADGRDALAICHKILGKI
ncbi:MAG: Gfo/Idh/MocA family oxidoreductase [Planctomycetes bacterium]|nr:Gfo/Idh/MocA family oxidoreductase [Planctomycetota bacterium]